MLLGIDRFGPLALPVDCPSACPECGKAYDHEPTAMGRRKVDGSVSCGAAFIACPCGYMWHAYWDGRKTEAVCKPAPEILLLVLTGAFRGEW